MALNELMLGEVCKRLKPGQSIASFGYPDFTASIEFCNQFLGTKEIAFREDWKDICLRHGITPARPVPDAESFFKAMGADLAVYDIVNERGCEIICDLNEPIPDNFAYYDFVLDVGTVEHCFNIGQAMLNMVGMLKVGGIILHENPFIMPNHGFYSMNPTFYADFYEQNGFKLLDCKLCTGRLNQKGTVTPPFTKRFNVEQEGESTTIFAMAERVEIVPLRWPTQTKYKKVLSAAAGHRAQKE